MVWVGVASFTLEDVQARHRANPQWLTTAADLTPASLEPLLPYYLPLAVGIAQRQAAARAPLTVGIQGPQGSGKSTLVALLQAVLRDVGDLRVVCLSIDDLYLTRNQREAMGERVHPLFVTRGVPGTHDVDLGVRVLTSLTQAGTTAVPRFDKGRDDRLPEAAWPRVDGPCDVILFEGLWVGLPPLPQDCLTEPVNDLERDEDPDGRWRRHASKALAETYPELFAPCQWLIHLAVPSFDCVRRWRTEAEHRLRRRLQASGQDTRFVMDEAALSRFFAHYERFTAHAMEAMPARADAILRVDNDHRVVALEEPAGR